MTYDEFVMELSIGTLTLEALGKAICDKDNNDKILEYLSKDDNFKNTIEDIIKRS